VTSEVDRESQDAPARPDADGEAPADEARADEAAVRPQQEPDAGAQAGETPPAAGAGPDEHRSEDDLLDEMQSRITELTGDLQRLQAEYLNYKRRVDRDRDLVLQNAKVNVLNSLLPVLDDIDRAREHGEVEGGFKAVSDSLDRTVSSLGLTKFGAPGDEFDPTLHEALMHGSSPDVDTTRVDVVAQAGYRIGERVVRAAKVTVLGPES
jgi:molecular chaperone GrpE